MKIKGRAWKFGDNINTDAIIAARYLVTTEPAELASHLMEDIRPGFAKQIKEGNIMVAGENFGCGSSREHAPLAIKGAGVSAVVAANFARIFYRNSFNMGLPIFECEEAARRIREGDEIEIEIDSGAISNLTKNEKYQAQAVSPFMRELLAAGGLVNYMVSRQKKRMKKDER